MLVLRVLTEYLVPGRIRASDTQQQTTVPGTRKIVYILDTFHDKTSLLFSSVPFKGTVQLDFLTSYSFMNRLHVTSCSVSKRVSNLSSDL
jgi:hypothetical protein